MHAGEPIAGVPRATYRLQLNRAFTLRDATALVPYFAELGVSHLYCSPYMRARPGSSHGYDVVDHNSINPEIGTREDLEAFVAALRAHRMGHVLDWVPNHVGIMGADNAWWMDVLENGPASIYAQFFDIAWENVDPALSGKLLVPVLGDHYGSTLERGELVLKFEADTGSFAIFYHEHRFPVDPREYPRILERASRERALEGLGEEERADYSSLIGAFGHLPDRRELAAAALEERNRDKEVHKRRLVRLCGRTALLPEAIEAAVKALNGVAGEPSSFDALHELIEAQAYRLAYWRVASDEINYRRFFDINDLAALRMENEAVFDATHRLVLELIAERKVDGLRIDHPDGLYDPAQYFTRLQSRVGEVAGGRTADELPLYLVVEKITAPFEPLRDDWRVHGATGYRFANVVSGVMVDSSARARIDRIYRSFTGAGADWGSIAHASKRLVVDTSLAAELNVLANELRGIARSNRGTRDFTQRSLRQALAEVIACFPVYRTYIADSVSAEDRRYIDWGIAHARRRESGIDAAVFDFVRAILFGEGAGALPAVAAAARRFAMKFQQVTAPVTAKGVEDTALYRFDRLVSLNEVGGEPDHFGTSVREFHTDARYRARHWPHELLASSTHDTKRSEDVRSRIHVLSEMPREWRRALTRWSRINRPRRRIVDEQPAPAPRDEYLLYQTLLGTFPLAGASAAAPEYVDRIVGYMVKAVREAKVNSSWANVNGAYEEAVQQFTRDILEPRPGNLFLPDLESLAARTARFGLLSALSQTLLKLTAPGVPDIYQGTELWDFSLVDPDNRRPVDYDSRRRLLQDLNARLNDPNARAAGLRELLDDLSDGRAKLYVISSALRLRAAHEALFARGAYLPLRARGQHSSSVIAFLRRHAGRIALTIAPRLYARLLANGTELPLGTAAWGDTWIELPSGSEGSMLTNVLDGASVPVSEVGGRRALALSEVLAHFPVALLVTP